MNETQPEFVMIKLSRDIKVYELAAAAAAIRCELEIDGAGGIRMVRRAVKKRVRSQREPDISEITGITCGPDRPIGTPRG